MLCKRDACTTSGNRQHSAAPTKTDRRSDLTTPAINAVREKFPEARITLVIASACRDMAPAIPNVDRFLIVRRNWRDIPIFLSVAMHRFEFCVDFTRNDRSACARRICHARRNGSPWYRPHDEPEGAHPRVHRFHGTGAACTRLVITSHCCGRLESKTRPPGCIWISRYQRSARRKRFSARRRLRIDSSFFIPAQRARKNFGKSNGGLS